MSHSMRHLTRVTVWAVAYSAAILAGTLGRLTTPSVESSGMDSLDFVTRNASDPIRGKFNGKLVFSSDRHNRGGLSIWTMNADGSSPTRLTDEKSRTDRLASFVHINDVMPAWSPDGTKVAFISNRDSTSSIYTVNADGTNLHLVTDKLSNSFSAAWSPDGKKIAFVVSRFPFGLEKATSDIYVINSDASGLTKLISDSGEDRDVTWSPDGKQIAFASNRDPDGRWRIWVMNSDGSNQRKLTDIHDTSNPIFYSDMTPSWSPDGTKILFTGSRDFNGTRNCYAVNCSEIFVMDADGRNDHAITNDPQRGGLYSSPKWSPDGTKIVTSVALGTIADVRNDINLGTAIIVMNADGSNQINLSSRSERYFVDTRPDWQPLLAPSSEPPPSILSLSAPAYSASEDSGGIPITVKRTGNLNAMASCYYATEDGTATVKNNYGTAFGTLRFGVG